MTMMMGFNAPRAVREWRQGPCLRGVPWTTRQPRSVLFCKSDGEAGVVGVGHIQPSIRPGSNLTEQEQGMGLWAHVPVPAGPRKRIRLR